HYHDDDLSGPDAAIELQIGGLPRGMTRVEQFRIDGQHGNAYAAWQRMGSPATVDQAGYQSLRAAGALAVMNEGLEARFAGSKATIRFALPRQGVSLLVFSASH